MIISDYYDLFKCYSGTFKKSPYQKEKSPYHIEIHKKVFLIK